MLDRIRPCYGRGWFHDAPHVLVVVGIKDQAWKRSYDGYCSVETDAAIATWQRVTESHSYARARVQLAELHLKTGQPDLAQGELREVLGDVRPLIDSYLDDTPRLVSKLESAAVGPDYPLLSQAAHSLKSSSANLGAMGLSAAAKRIARWRTKVAPFQ